MRRLGPAALGDPKLSKYLRERRSRRYFIR